MEPYVVSIGYCKQKKKTLLSSNVKIYWNKKIKVVS